MSAISTIVPGAGQLLSGRPGDALLFAALASWLHLILGGLAWGIAGDAVWDGLLYGGLGFPSGHLTPTVVATTSLMVAVHLFAGWDALGRRVDEADLDEEVQGS